MRISAILLALAILAILALNLPAMLISPPRHLNPLSLNPEGPSPLEMLQIYLNIAHALSGYDLVSAKGNLSYAATVYIPENLRAIVNRFNGLLEQLIFHIEDTRDAIDEARALINASNYRDASGVIEKGFRSLARARVIYYELLEASNALASIGLPIQRLKGVLDAIGGVIEDLRKQLEALNDIVSSNITRVIGTRIEIQVYPTNVTIGEYVRISGYLADERGDPLTDRSVVVHFGDESMETSTGPEGIYSLSVRADVYKPVVRVYAEYIPRGRDVGVYSYSRSEDLFVTIYYITPELEVSLDRSRVRPGDEVSIYVRTIPGLLIVIESPFDRQRTVTSTGSVVVPISIPYNVSDGTYTIKVKTLPAGIIGPAERSISLDVYRDRPDIRIYAPSYIFTGYQYSIKLESSVSSRIRVLSVVNTSIEGGDREYVLRLLVPHSYIGTSVVISLEVIPLDLRYSSAIVSVEIPVYNTVLVSMAIAVPAVFAVTVYHIERVRSRSLAMRRPQTIPATPAEAAPASESSSKAVELGIRGEASELFYTLSSLIERFTGIIFKKSYTLREYLYRLKGVLATTIYDLVEKAFLAFERLVYGDPSRVDQALAETVSALIKRALSAIRGLMGRGGG